MEFYFLVLCFIKIMSEWFFRQISQRKTPVFAAAGIESVFPEYMLYFAADEKTEQPTSKKLSDTRKKGQVAKSPDLNAAIILLIAAVMLAASGDEGFKLIYRFFYGSFNNYLNYSVSEGNLRGLTVFYIAESLKIVGILFLTVMISGIAANLAQSGFLFSLDPLKPNFKRLNPIEGMKNLFSKRALFTLVKSIAKLLLIGYISYNFIKKNIEFIFSITGISYQALFPFMKGLLSGLLFQIVAALLIIGIVDFVFQKYEYKKNLRMTKQEVKEEYKQMEGDPKIKGARRQKQRQMSMNRMMSAVSKATVIVTNPTHLAVALKYEHNVDPVPVLVGKGADYIAAKIRELAKENNIPIVENKPLAQLLYKKVEIGQEVPPVFYQAVAEILAAVIRMKKKAI